MIEVTVDIVKELLDYDPATGEFRWKPRSREWFSSDRSWKRWNTRYTNTVAGNIRSDDYRRIQIDKKRYRAQRLAWLYHYEEWPQNHIDHINHQTDDNRIENLRDVTGSQNQWNGSIRSGTTSQYKGVCWDKASNKWKAYIRINGKRTHLGYFEIEIDTARAYDRAALEHFGMYAKLNFSIEDYL
jgi:hypothetical protein